MRCFAPLLLTAALLTACAAARPAERDLTVFAAASLTDAFTEMAAAFEQANPGVRVRLNTAGSSQLAAQLLEGAPADVFASADRVQMANVAGLTEGEPAIFATNRLVGIVPPDNPAGITTFADFTAPGVLIVVAAPGVPVRTYTDQLLALNERALAEGFYANIASEEDNVRQVLAKVALGEADAGVVYGSDVTAAVGVIRLPHAEQVQAAYPIAVLADAPQPELARAFVDFVLSDEGQAILQEWGFGPRR